MTPLLVLVALASTPLIEGYLLGCAAPVDARGASAAAAGKVVAVKAGHVEVSHCFFENADVRVVLAVFDGLASVEVKEGDVVARGQRLGRGAKPNVTIDGVAAADFVRGREQLLVPPREPVLVVVDVEAHRAVRFEAGVATHTWGCVVLHPEEVRGFYDVVPLGTAVVLL